jgi:hypothetical protein
MKTINYLISNFRTKPKLFGKEGKVNIKKQNIFMKCI